MNLHSLSCSLLLCCCSLATPAPLISFKNVTDSANIDFTHTDGSSGKRWIVETIASGLGLIDFDNDGYLDIYFLNGSPLPGASPLQSPPANALYRNNHDGTFLNVSHKSGTALTNYSVGCVVADYDNDGDEDLFVSNYGPHTLLRNNGNGTFTDSTAQAGLAGSSHGADCVGGGCAFLDFDKDGHLDLYIGNYLQFDPARSTPCVRGSVSVYCSPKSFPPLSDRLYRNKGNGTFQDVSESSGIGRFKGYTMGVVCSDFDGDGWPDIFVGNDVQENFLFLNKRDGTFQEIATPAGVAYDLYGIEQGVMGVNAGDYDGDGRFDILVTTYQNQVNTLYKNLGSIQGQLQFQDVTIQTGIGTGSLPLVTWGCGFADFDNDRSQEIFIAAGHLQDTVEQYDSSSSYKQRSQLFQMRSGRFIDIASEIGGPFRIPESSRGSVLGDLNNDGRMDIVILNARSKPALFLNDSATSNHWTTLKLIGTRSNRSAVGARARLSLGATHYLKEIRAGSSYQSAEDLRLHFGLGTNSAIDRVEITWPGGLKQTWTNLPSDRVLRLTEGEEDFAAQP